MLCSKFIRKVYVINHIIDINVDTCLVNYHACPYSNLWFRKHAVNCLDWICAIHWLIYKSNLNWISQPMLHCCLCFCSPWHHNAAIIAPVMSQWDTHWGALSNQTVALLVLLQSIWYKFGKIVIFNGWNYYIHPLKQQIGNTNEFSIHDKSESVCCCGISQ